VLGSVVHLEKMVMNLILNAAEAMDEGVRSALQLGATFVNKPYRLDEIARAVKNTLYGN
jgi:C4-dicarboxylate-specific signal transduction histidine kinase